MKYGVREICDVVLKAKGTQKVGNKIFYKNEPVIYFDSLKTSSLEGAATTVYAQGGRGNARLMAWEGDRTMTFTMEDALISPEGLMILTGAGLIEASAGQTIKQHITETVDASMVEGSTIYIENKPYLPSDGGDNFAYVMFVKDDEIISEPYIPVHEEAEEGTGKFEGRYGIKIQGHDNYVDLEGVEEEAYTLKDAIPSKNAFDSVIVDYYTEKNGGAKEIEITPDKFGGNYYLEASTLWKNSAGIDEAAEFIIPNCKIQSNFTFTMASTGDPSTFQFTLDAFPDYTRFDHSKKVLAKIQVIETGSTLAAYRKSTSHSEDHDKLF